MATVDRNRVRGRVRNRCDHVVVAPREACGHSGSALRAPLPEGFIESSATNSPPAVPSPDGRYLAFVAQEPKTSKNYLWVRPLGSLSAQRLDKSEGADFPFWQGAVFSNDDWRSDGGGG